jgi:hypothetical protein
MSDRFFIEQDHDTYMGVVQRARSDIFAEPNGGQIFRLLIGFGLVAIGIAIVFFNLVSGPTLVGIGFVFWGSAEVLSSDRTLLAGILRLCSIASFCSVFILGISDLIGL